MKEDIKVFLLGGNDEEGRTLLVVEINEDIFIIDDGIKYPDKTTPGIDFILPNHSYLFKNKHRIKAFLISHGHKEACGALSIVYKDIPAPIYCSKVTASILEKFKDERFKFTYDIHIVEPSSTFEINGREITFFQVCHNMAGASGIAISTMYGNIIYSGEFICEFDSNNPSFKFDLTKLAKLGDKNTLLLLSESSKATLDGFCAPYHRYTSHVEDAIIHAKGMVLLATFIESFYAISEIIETCLRLKRKISLINKNSKEIISLLSKLGIIKVQDSDFIDSNQIGIINPSEVAVLYINSGEELYNDVLNFLKDDSRDYPFRLKESDTVILAAPPATNLEALFTDTVNELFKTDAKIYYFTRKTISSMHARRDDLKLLLSILKPKYYAPINGYFASLMANANLALDMKLGFNYNNVFVLDNGMPIKFIDGIGKVISDPEIDASPVILDGLGSSLIDNVLEDRNQMTTDGFVFVSSAISLSKEEFITKPDCQMKGFVFSKECEPLVKLITGIYFEEIVQAFRDKRYKKDEVISKISERIAKNLRKITRRNPKIIVKIIEVD